MASKYTRGCYHYVDFANPNSDYHKHVTDLVRRVKELVPKESEIFEVGSGEGLILSELDKAGFFAYGCDVDKLAVDLACGKGNDVRHGTVFEEKGSYAAVLMCDVLEHVELFEETIAAAKKLAPLIFVAVPDRKDPHAVRQNIVDAVVNEFLGWEMVSVAQRNARWMLTFRKIA